jgi:D-glycero-D-manno-heptose 1,7-bisphosphate phosphatase
MHKAIFMDRDGTVSKEKGYIRHPDQYEVFSFTGQAVRRINESGAKAILITNQSGVGRGYFTETILGEIHDVLHQELARWNAHLDAIYFCPHTPADLCDCRKPRVGMLLRAQREMDIDLANSYFIGDRYLDIHAAHAVGARSVLVLTGDGQMELDNRKHEDLQPTLVAENLLVAVETILNGSRP